MEYLNAFLCGGILCAVGQIIIDKTQLTPARILTGYVVVGVLLSALGLYEPLAQWGGAGATVPLTGFGHTLAKGVREAVASDGWIGIFTGGLTAAAGGVTAAVVAGVLMAAIFRPGGNRCRPVLILSFFCCSFLSGFLLYYGHRQKSTERNIRSCAVLPHCCLPR